MTNDQLSLFTLRDRYTWCAGGCRGCDCIECLYWWSGRCPYGGCWDEYRANCEPWPGEVRKYWSDWNKPGEQRHWCRGGDTYTQRGYCDRFVQYTGCEVLKCLEAMISKYQDGYICCSLIDNQGCEVCYKRFEERLENE